MRLDALLNFMTEDNLKSILVFSLFVMVPPYIALEKSLEYFGISILFRWQYLGILGILLLKLTNK